MCQICYRSSWASFSPEFWTVLLTLWFWKTLLKSMWIRPTTCAAAWLPSWSPFTSRLSSLSSKTHTSGARPEDDAHYVLRPGCGFTLGTLLICGLESRKVWVSALQRETSSAFILLSDSEQQHHHVTTNMLESYTNLRQRSSTRVHSH